MFEEAVVIVLMCLVLHASELIQAWVIITIAGAITALVALKGHQK